MRCEVPLVTAEQIAAAWRPGSNGTASSSVGALRRRGFITSGIDAPLRDSLGRLRGKVTLYSSLARDAATELRVGRPGVAERLVRMGELIERTPPAIGAARTIAYGRARSPETTILQLLAKAARPGDPGYRPMSMVGRSTARARRSILGDLTERELFGRAATRGSGADAWLLLEDGTVTLPLPDDPAWASLAGCGTQVCVRVTQTGSDQLILTYSLTLEDGDAPDGHTPDR